jgi:hypothetical protein
MDSATYLHKAILEREIQILKSKLKPADTGTIHTAISVLEWRLKELERNGKV